MRKLLVLFIFLISFLSYAQIPPDIHPGGVYIYNVPVSNPTDTLVTLDDSGLMRKVSLDSLDLQTLTFSDTAEIDLTLTGDDVTADLVAGSIDETKLDASVNASLDLADSALQISDITGAASTIVTSDLTNNRALISNGSGKVAVSAVTSTELSYVGGVTSALQTQLNAKLNSSSYTAADVLAKLLTVDGSGSGLDADLLRGAHWGNVDTDILTTGSGTFGGQGINGTVSTDTGGITSANSWKIGKNAQGTYLNLVNSSGGTTNAILRSYSAAGVQFVLSEGGITAAGNSVFAGTVTATNFILSSDKRLKQNFTYLDNGYYSFEFKDKPGEKRYGVIAQEVKKYAPVVVSEGEDGYLKVAYIDLLIKKNAELTTTVEDLEESYTHDMIFLSVIIALYTICIIFILVVILKPMLKK